MRAAGGGRYSRGPNIIEGFEDRTSERFVLTGARIDELAECVADMRTRLPRAFATLVPGNFEIKRMAPEVEPGAPGAYGGPGSIDGKVPGKFWINLRTTDLWRRFSLPTLTYHESLPGHVWQGEYTFKLPLVRSLLAFNAYSEGWALYAEQLADELGVYENDPFGRLGYLQSIAFRACRLVASRAWGETCACPTARYRPAAPRSGSRTLRSCSSATPRPARRIAGASSGSQEAEPPPAGSGLVTAACSSAAR